MQRIIKFRAWCDENAPDDVIIFKLMKRAYLAGASAMNGSAGVPTIDLDKAANLIINRLDDLAMLYNDVYYGLPIHNEQMCDEMKQLIIKTIQETVSSPAPQTNSAGVSEKKFELFKGNFISLVDRILRDKGASNKEVFDAMETAFEDLKSEISPSPLEAETADKK